MRSVLLSVVALLFCAFSRAQPLLYATSMVEYQPAPGQHINTAITGSPDAALGVVNRIGNPLSLGAYGGYLILGFDEAVDNHPDNPYGVDLIVYGNASATHAEPGIIRVMRDVNQNGLPDDIWYEIAGSAHFTNDLETDYSIVYRNPKQTLAADVPWTDNSNLAGKVFKNSFYNQPYYPLTDFFPGISTDSLSFGGSRLAGNVEIRNGIYSSLPYAFGYADNLPVKNQNDTGLPDNPYTLDILEGDGGDAIDISWAVDSDGSYVELPEIDFLMIYTGVNASAGWLGEISTDVRGVVDVKPDKSIQGPRKMILANENPNRIALGGSMMISARALISGRHDANESILWESLNPGILSVSNGVIEAKSAGTVIIRGSLDSDSEVFINLGISVVAPKELLLETHTLTLLEGEIASISFSLVDEASESIGGMVPSVSIEDQSVVSFVEVNDSQLTIKADSPGKTLLTLGFPDFPHIASSLEIIVVRRIDPIQIHFSVSGENGSILPMKSYRVGKADIMGFTDRHLSDFNPDKPFISLADAIVSVLNTEGFGTLEKSLAFRQDAYGGNRLYLWQLGSNWEYQYGWGGDNTSDTYAKTWFAVVNNRVFASGFDTIEVVDGDRISLRHIEDNRASWSLIRVNPPKTEIQIGEKITFHAEQLDISPTSQGDFDVSGPFPVVGASVIVDESLVFAEDSYPTTSYTGAFSLSFNQGGSHLVSVENSEPLRLEVLFPLGIEDAATFSMYPNPCHGQLSISGLPVNASELRIYSMEGRLKKNTTIEKGALSMDMNVGELEKGFYVLEILSPGKSSKKKLCKI